jgi:acyl carrier protein
MTLAILSRNAEAAAADARAEILAIVRRALPEAAKDAAIEAGTPLSRLGLSSMASVSLMFAVEGHFGFVIPDAELRPENFRSVGAIVALVERMQGA